MGDGWGTLSKMGGAPPTVSTPFPPPLPKAFVFIESLLPAFPVDEKGI